MQGLGVINIQHLLRANRKLQRAMYGNGKYRENYKESRNERILLVRKKQRNNEGRTQIRQEGTEENMFKKTVYFDAGTENGNDGGRGKLTTSH